MHSSRQRLINTILMMILVAIADSSSNLLAPSLPLIQDFFSAKLSTTQLTLSLNIMGLAVSGLVYGPLSDHYGRRKVGVVGFFMFAVATALNALSQDIYQLIFFRFLQGLGEGVAMVVAYSSIKDMYQGEKCAQVISQLNLIAAFSPAVAPVLGGIIASYYSWRGIFILLTLISLVVWFFLYFSFKETAVINVNKFRFSNVLKGYWAVITNKRFICYILIQSSAFVWLWGEIANWPFIFHSMGVRVENYGWYIALSVLFYMIGTIINQIFVKRVGIDRMLLIGILLTSLDALAVLYAKLFVLTPLIISLLSSMECIGLALIIGNGAARALEAVEGHAGAGSSVMVFMQMGMGTLGVFLTGKFCAGSVSCLWTTTVYCSMFALAVYLYIRRKPVNNVQAG